MIRFFIVTVAYLSANNVFAAQHPAFVGFRSQAITPRTVAFSLKEDIQAAEAHYQKMRDEWKGLEEQMKELMERKKNGDKGVAKEATSLAESMLEKAAATAAAKRYAIELESMIAESDLHHAHLDRQFADDFATALSHEASDDARVADDRAFAIEGFDSEAEDLERRRDLSLHHSASHLMEGAKATVHEMEDVKLHSMEDVVHKHQELAQLERAEEELKQTLKELHALMNEQNMKEWKAKQ
eukprot:CAMPEP_0185723748 /NCGR_PEP_ID=MMETSP1171-20130828/483_1 /TAXON_ID=374046 /ORGANISM="Helicotheca tamensis, Strain CCMP826" /LENGTH=240 /DNA_ID=CAMNT_0028391499 /DNA_START=50 /DNA_END=772 /DNA_ORIENTATION=+